MADVPSIKAIGFQSAADDVARLVAEGRLARAELEARGCPRATARLGKQLAASSWVPIATYVRVAAILVELEGQGRRARLLPGAGGRAAERLHKAGVYRQFDASVETWGKRARLDRDHDERGPLQLHALELEALPDRGGFEIRIDGAREFPDALRYVGEGFIEYVSMHQSGRKKVAGHERATPRPTGSSYTRAAVVRLGQSISNSSRR